MLLANEWIWDGRKNNRDRTRKISGISDLALLDRAEIWLKYLIQRSCLQNIPGKGLSGFWQAASRLESVTRSEALALRSCATTPWRQNLVRQRVSLLLFTFATIYAARIGSIMLRAKSREIVMRGSHLPMGAQPRFSSQFSVLSSQFSVLSSQFSISASGFRLLAFLELELVAINRP